LVSFEFVDFPIEKRSSGVTTLTSLSFCYAQAKKLWADQGIKDNLAKIGKFEYYESLNYVMEHLARISGPDWKLTNEDVLHIRQRTTGIVETRFKVCAPLYPLFRPFSTPLFRFLAWPPRHSPFSLCFSLARILFRSARLHLWIFRDYAIL
jgi:hypothetical protein